MNKTRHSTKPVLVFLIGSLISLAACSPQPTPYQPKTEDFGYEETRLQENVYRISFKANRYTNESDVMDYLYLRSAELTKESGFSHFMVDQSFGKSQLEGESNSGFSMGMGFGSFSRRSLWGAGFSTPLGDGGKQYSVKYHLGVFVIKMLTPEQAKKEKDAFEVNFLIDSMRKKQNLPAQIPSK